MALNKKYYYYLVFIYSENVHFKDMHSIFNSIYSDISTEKKSLVINEEYNTHLLMFIKMLVK